MLDFAIPERRWLRVGTGQLNPGKSLGFVPLSTLVIATPSHDQPSLCAEAASLAFQVLAKATWPCYSLWNTIAFFLDGNKRSTNSVCVCHILLSVEQKDYL